MSAGACAALCCAWLFVAGVSVSADQEITAESGTVVFLPCRAPNSNPIRAVAWTKPALQDEHVYLYRDGRFHPEEQNPIFRNRVDLQDAEMKGGDVSLVLKDVTVNDAGTYECRVVQKGSGRSIKAASSIDLRVAPPGPGGGGGQSRNGSFGLLVHLCVPVLLLAVTFFVF